MIRKIILILFLFIIFHDVFALTLVDFRRLKSRLANQEVNITLLQEKLNSIVPQNKHIKKILSKEKALITKYIELENVKRKVIEDFLNKKWSDYLKLSKHDFVLGSFEEEFREAPYLLNILRSKKELKSYNIYPLLYVIATFSAERVVTFSYRQAIKVYKKIKNKKQRENFKAVIKRFLEQEIASAKNISLGKSEEFFLK